MMLAHRDALERRYDGPIPPADPAASTEPAGLRARLFQRLAREAREQTAGRRAQVAAGMVLADRRLGRLTRDLGLYRHQGLVWHD